MPKSKDQDKENVKPQPKPKDDDKARTIDFHCETVGGALANIFVILEKDLELAKKCVSTIQDCAMQLNLNTQQCVQALGNYFNKDGSSEKQSMDNYADLPNACTNALKAFKPNGPRPEPNKSESPDPNDKLKLSNLKEGYSKMLGLGDPMAELAAGLHLKQEKSGNNDVNPQAVVKAVAEAFAQSGGNPEAAAINLATSHDAPNIADAATSPKSKSPFALPTTVLPPKPPGTIV